MIITARIAAAQANQTLKRPHNWERPLMRQLRKIEKAINRSSKKGKKSMPYYRKMPKVIRRVLEANGYKIIERCSYDCGEWLVIDWETKN